jgi:Holliday junction resolvasome RuvABC endonuclease subunit
MKANRVLGIDPGNNYGWAIWTDAQSGFGKFKTLGKFKWFVENLMTFAPDAVFTCRAMGRSNPSVIRRHGAINGIIELVCEEKGIPYFDIADSTMRKEIMGKGNAKKDEVMEFTGIENEHAADALIAAMYGYKMLEKVL